jgi:hypothetical protein
VAILSPQLPVSLVIRGGFSVPETTFSSSQAIGEFAVNGCVSQQKGASGILTMRFRSIVCSILASRLLKMNHLTTSDGKSAPTTFDLDSATLRTVDCTYDTGD